jgi:hypothetical protein
LQWTDVSPTITTVLVVSAIILVASSDMLVAIVFSFAPWLHVDVDVYFAWSVS